MQKHDQFCDLAKFLCIFFVRTAPPAPARALPPPRPARPAGNRPAHPRTWNPRCQWHWPCGPGRAARAPLQHALQLSLHATSPSQAAAPAPPRSPARGPPPRPRHPNLAAGLASRLSGQQSHFRPRCTRSKSTHQSPFFFDFRQTGLETQNTRLRNKNYQNVQFLGI